MSLIHFGVGDPPREEEEGQRRGERTHHARLRGGEPRRRHSDWGGEARLEFRTKEKGRNGAQGWKRCTFKYWRINKKIHGLILGGATASAFRSKVIRCLKVRRKMMVLEHMVGKK